MKIFGYGIHREHPTERNLRRWGQLSPELKELILRAVRSVAKDQVQEVLEHQGKPYRNPSYVWGHSAVHPCGHSVYNTQCEMFSLAEVDEYDRWVATLPRQEQQCES